VLFALKLFGADAKIAAPAVIKLLKDDKNAQVRCVAADFLGKCGADTALTVRALKAVAKTSGEPAIHAIAALKAFGPEAKAAVPELRVALQEKALRPYAAQALATIKGDGLAVLEEALQDKEDDLRVEVVVALRLAGKDGVPVLVIALRDKSAEVRLNAVDALGRLGPDAKDAEPALTEAKKDPEQAVRAAAEEALMLIRKK
jgi:HEAT repeat protein